MVSTDREVRQALERTQSELARTRRELDELRRRGSQERLESTARLEEERKATSQLAEAERQRAADARRVLTEKQARIAQLEAALSRSRSSAADALERGVIIGPEEHSESETGGPVHRNTPATDSPEPGVIIGPARAVAQGRDTDGDTDMGPFRRVGLAVMGLILLVAMLGSREFDLCWMITASGLFALAAFTK